MRYERRWLAWSNPRTLADHPSQSCRITLHQKVRCSKPNRKNGRRIVVATWDRQAMRRRLGWCGLPPERLQRSFWRVATSLRAYGIFCAYSNCSFGIDKIKLFQGRISRGDSSIEKDLMRFGRCRSFDLKSFSIKRACKNVTIQCIFSEKDDATF